MADPLPIGVVGLGQRGLQHLKALWTLQEQGKTRIVVICDAFESNLDEEKIRKFVPGMTFDGVLKTTDFDKALDAGPKAMYFAIPPGLHDGQLIKATRAGLHIFAEKPQSLFLDEAIEMGEEIEKAGVISTVGFQRRYESQSVTTHAFMADKRPVMATMVNEGFLEAHSVKHTDTGAMGGPKDNVWAKSFEWSGSTVVEAGIHQTDLMRFWMGDIAWTQSAYVPRDAEDIEDGGDNPYSYTVTYGFKNGAVGNLIMSRLRKVYRNDGYQNLIWDHGHLKLEGSGVTAYYYDGAYPPDGRPGQDQIKHSVPTPDAVNTTLAIATAFVKAIEVGNHDPLLSTYASSMNSLAAVLAANFSHELEGERIDLDELLTADRYADLRRKKKP
jgi:predicted dehydrogenase